MGAPNEQRSTGSNARARCPAGPEEAIPVKKRTMHVPDLLNEAFHYAKPVPFSRGMRLDFGSTTVLLISGTASIDERGQTVHVGDLRAQTRRTFKNLTGLLGRRACRS